MNPVLFKAIVKFCTTNQLFMFFIEKLNSQKKRQFCLAVLAYANLLHCTPSTSTKTLQLTKKALLLSTKKTEIAEASNPGVLYIPGLGVPKTRPLKSIL